MRWKLLIAASLLAAAAGAGVCYAAARYLVPFAGPNPAGWVTALPLIAPLGAITYAAIFVYRHTPRRRALQAASTAVLASLLTLAAFTLVSVLTGRPAPEPLPALPSKNA